MHRIILILLVAILLAAPPLTAEDERHAAAAVLDALHAAASKADAVRYWGVFAEDAVFLGTDPTERWTIEEFRGYADPFFSQGRGWTYRVVERHVFLGSGGTVAWFDEELSNETYGSCRGTGVLVLVDGSWKIAQYNLSIPIPNDLTPAVVELIQGGRGRSPSTSGEVDRRPRPRLR